MAHEHGDVPGPTTKRGGQDPANSAPPRTRAAEPTASPEAPLGFDEGTSETPGTEREPVREKYYNPSAGESAQRTPEQGSRTGLPGEDS